MGLESGPDSGSFEVVPATFHDVIYPANPTGEAVPVKSDSRFCQRKIRIVNSFSSEAQNAGTTVGYSTLYLEIYRDNKTRLLKTEMVMVWLGQEYGIVSIGPKPFNKRLIALTVKSRDQ